MMYSDNEFNHNSLQEGKGMNRRQRRLRRKLRATAAVLAGAAVITGSFLGGAMLSGSSTSTVEAATSQSLNISNDLTDITSASLTDYSDLVDQCMPQVVSITNVIEITSTTAGSGSMYDFFYGRSGQSQGSQSQVDETEAYGSGVIIGKTDSELLIVTNNHVAVYDESGNSMFYSYTASTKELQVSFVDGTTVTANLKGADADADIAVIAVDLSNISQDTLNAISIATVGSSDEVKVGQGVMAIGNALGEGQTATFGHVSALNKEVTTSDDGITRSLMQIDAAINSGNSGGGLFNAQGHLIGINSAKSSGVGIEGMGYAIPISSVEEIINDLMNEKTKIKLSEEERGYLGIQGADVPSSYVTAYGMPEGALITKITSGSPAETTGLQVSDIVTGVDGQKITSYEELRSALSYYAAGEAVTITVKRPSGNQYSEMQFTVTLANRADIVDETVADTDTDAESEDQGEQETRVQLQKAE